MTDQPDGYLTRDEFVATCGGIWQAGAYLLSRAELTPTTRIVAWHLMRMDGPAVRRRVGAPRLAVAAGASRATCTRALIELKSAKIIALVDTKSGQRWSWAQPDRCMIDRESQTDQFEHSSDVRTDQSQHSSAAQGVAFEHSDIPTDQDDANCRKLVTSGVAFEHTGPVAFEHSEVQVVKEVHPKSACLRGESVNPTADPHQQNSQQAEKATPQENSNGPLEAWRQATGKPKATLPEALAERVAKHGGDHVAACIEASKARYNRERTDGQWYGIGWAVTQIDRLGPEEQKTAYVDLCGVFAAIWPDTPIAVRQALQDAFLRQGVPLERIAESLKRRRTRAEAGKKGVEGPTKMINANYGGPPIMRQVPVDEAKHEW